LDVHHHCHLLEVAVILERLQGIRPAASGMARPNQAFHLSAMAPAT